MRSLFRTLLSLSIIHWLTGVGVVLTTASAVIFFVLLFQRVENPYFGIIVFLILPALFLLGLILMPLGVFIGSHRLGGFRKVLERVPAEGPRAARLAWAFAFLTLANVGILALASHGGVNYMDSKEFCGQACHSVMQPQYVRYQKSPHARIPCVDCHVGAGAASFVQYKLAGARQLVRLTTGTYDRPISPAMDRMRSAAELCEQCHTPGKVKDDRLKVISHYSDDERSTKKITVLLMKTDTRIHKAHAGLDIQYQGEKPDSQMISTVTVDGKTYSVEGAKSEGVIRKMDCMDCHNRSGHDFETPESAVDQAIADGRLDRLRPFARRDAVAALKTASGLEAQPASVQMIRSENVFARMAIDWAT